jgi:hypothetical protein
MKTPTGFPLRVVTAIAVILTMASAAWAQVNVLTRNYNNQRTGTNLAETILNTSNVNSAQFGKLFMLPVDDQVFAGILYVSNLTIAGGVHNVIYVATVNNTVYAFDADTFGPPLWQRSFNGTGRPTHNNEVGQACGTYQDFMGNGDFGNMANIGIVGTPVIDGTTNTMYFVVRTVEGATPTFMQRLRAIDITTGLDRLTPQVIDNTVTFPGTGEDSDGTNVHFNPMTANQRPGLVLSNGVIYVGWSSYCDTHPYHGWVMSFDPTSLTRLGAFTTTPNGSGASAWMSGAAPAVDAAGSIYITTGNGSNNASTDFSESMLKLAPTTLTLQDWFTATNFNNLDNTDLDFNPSGPVMLPGTNFVTTGAKEGKIYVVDTGNLGHIAPGDTQIQQVFQAVDPTPRGTGTHHIHNASPVWNSPEGLNLYVWGENDFLHGFRWDPVGKQFMQPAFSSGGVLAPAGMPGGHMVISSNGATPNTGVLWSALPRNGDANQMTVAGHLFAFNAETLALLWSSTGPGDDTLNFAKGSPPVEANGKVYLASQSNFVSVYGLKSGPPVNLNLALGHPATGSATSGSAPCDPGDTPDKAFNGSSEGGITDKWCSAVSNPFLQVDLGSTFSVNRFLLEFGGAGGEDLGTNIGSYLIQVSVDGTNFETVADVTRNVFSIATHDITPTIGRFVRLVVLSPVSASSPASVYEFQVFGSAAPATADFLIAATPNFQTVTVGGTTTFATAVVPVNGFSGSVALSVSGLPAGTTGTFSPATITGGGSSTLSIDATNATAFGTFPLTLTATSGSTSHTTVAFLTVNRNATGSVIVNLAASYNVAGIFTDGTMFDPNGGLDGGGSAYSANQLGGPSISFTGVPFTIGPPNVPDVVSGVTVPLPAGQFSQLGILAAAVNGNAANALFTVTYSDGTTDVIIQGVSDWFTPQNFPGEAVAVPMPYRDVFDGTKDSRPFNLYAYFLPLNPAKKVSSVTLAEPRAMVLAMTLLPANGIAPDFALSASPSSLSIVPESTATSKITVTRLGGFRRRVHLSVSGVPPGIRADLDRRGRDMAVLVLRASKSAHVGPFAVTITGTVNRRGDDDDDRHEDNDGDDVVLLTHSIQIALDVREEAASPVQVDLTSSFIRTGIYTDGSVFSPNGGFDGGGAAYSANQIASTTITFDGTVFQLGPVNLPDVVSSANQAIPVPAGKFSTLQILAAAVQGDQAGQTVKANYSDGTSDSFTQGFTDWFALATHFPGESIAKDAGYRNFSGGNHGRHHVDIYGYMFPLNNSKTIISVTLPADDNVGVLAMTLVPQACIYALNQSAANGLTLNGPFNVNADCGVVVNSNSATALTSTGTGTLTAEDVRVAGGVSATPTTTITPAPSTKALVQPDPFRFLTPPAVDADCDHTNFMVHGEEAELRPGTYCNGITIMAGSHEEAEVRFRPGTYVLMGGGLNVQGPARLFGEGVTFFVTQGLGFNYGPVTIDSKVVSILTAPHSGPMEGILFFQDPTIAAGQPGSSVSGSSASRIEGVLYLPTTALSYSVPGPGGDFLVLVADTVTISGSVVLNNDFSDLSQGSPIHRVRDRDDGNPSHSAADVDNEPR